METIFLFIILFIYGFAVILMSCVALKNKKYKNKVHFYVTYETTEHGDIIRTLWLGKPLCTKEKNVFPHFYGTVIAYDQALSLYNLDYSEFEDMKNGEIREVFLNMEE